MYRKRIKLMQVMVVAVVMIGLLVAAWPGVAQGTIPDANAFRKLRLQEPGPFRQLPATEKSLVQTPAQINSLSTWSITDFGLQGSYPDIALDSAGGPHVLANSYYTYFDGQGWRAETVSSGSYTSLALDAANQPHFTYSDNGLKHAYRDVNGWHTETIAAVGSLSQLVIGTDNRPQAVYIDGSLKYAYRDAAGWHSEPVSSSATEVALALDTAGRPHVLYVSSDNLYYGFRDTSGWHLQQIQNAENFPAQPSIVVAPSGQVHISYCAWCRNYYGGVPHVNYGYYNGNLWRIEPIPPAYYEGWTNSIALDPAGQPHVAYNSNADGFGKLRHARRTATGWIVNNIDGMYMTDPVYNDPQPKVALAVDAAGRAHLAYYVGAMMYGNGQLRYARQHTDVGKWSRLTFASYRDENWEVYTANGDGGGQLRSTNDPTTYDSMPKLNRDGTRIAYVSNRDDSNEIYTMNLDGSGRVRLTNNGADDFRPSWSPDGLKIAFYSNRDGNYEIYTMNANGSGQTRLTNNTAWDGHPTWSPDGTQIAFASDRGGENEIWIMNADGSNPHQITFDAHAGYPDWSPDGSRLVFNDDTNHDGWLDIGMINADGTNFVHPAGFSPANYDYLAPVWAPHGDDLAFAKIQWIYYYGNYYWIDAYLTDLDLTNNSIVGMASSGLDWWPDWQNLDLTMPSSQVNPLPTWSRATFTVTWNSNNDIGPVSSGVRSYDIQFRDGAASAWTRWLTSTAQTNSSFTGLDGHWYCFRSRARDYARNLEAYPTSNGDACTTVDTTPPTASTTSPVLASTPTFIVTWSGTDTASGISTYDIQYRDGEFGAWTDWITATTQTTALFDGQLQHTYYFRARARDRLGNQGTFAPNGDSLTHTPLFSLVGNVTDNRAKPIAMVTVTTTPTALNNPRTDYRGDFDLYYNLTGIISLTVTRSNFGQLPQLLNVTVPSSNSLPTLYLPPLDNQISDSHFESGDLSLWNSSGDLTPTITSTAHTGNYAALLGGSVPTNTVTVGPWHSTIEQTINVSPTIVSHTLSLLYRVESAEPLSDTLTAYVVGANNTLTFTLPVTATDWTHAWFDLSAWTEPTATLKLDFAPAATGRLAEILIDEVTWGSTVKGAYAVFLPLVRR